MPHYIRYKSLILSAKTVSNLCKKTWKSFTKKKFYKKKFYKKYFKQVFLSNLVETILL